MGHRNYSVSIHPVNGTASPSAVFMGGVAKNVATHAGAVLMGMAVLALLV